MKVHIFVATTNGLVAIQNIIPIGDSDINSVVSINGTSTTANISAAYHGFVRKGAGIIEDDFGCCSYRVNVSDRIDHGGSWQLAFYLAHFSSKNSMLGDGLNIVSNDSVIVATGEINTADRQVIPVEQVPLKLQLAAKPIKNFLKIGANVVFIAPLINTENLPFKKYPCPIEPVTSIEQALRFISSEGTSYAKPYYAEQFLSKLARRIAEYRKSITSSLVAVVFFGVLYSQNWYTPELQQEVSTEEQSKEKAVGAKAFPLIHIRSNTKNLSRELNRAYEKIESTLSSSFVSHGFEVSLTGINSESQINQSPVYSTNRISLAVHYQMDVETTFNDDNELLNLTLFTQVIDESSSNVIETHSELGIFSDLPESCNRDCYSRWLSKKFKLLAQDMAAILVEKIQDLPIQRRFFLRFNSFTPQELKMMQQLLQNSDAQGSVILLNEFNNKATLFHQTVSKDIAYRSSISFDKVNTTLASIFHQLDIPITIERNNETLVFSRTRMPYFHSYFAVGIVMVLILAHFVLSMRRRKIEHNLKELHNKNRPQKWLSHFKSIRLPSFYHNSEWLKYEQSCLDKIDRSQSQLKGAQSFIRQFEWQKAERLLLRAIADDEGNDEAHSLLKQLATIKEGSKLYHLVKNASDFTLDESYMYLADAEHLAPTLKEDIDQLRKTIAMKVDREAPLSVVDNVRSALAKNKYYDALAAIDRFLNCAENKHENGAIHEKINVLRKTIVHSMKPIIGNLSAQFGSTNLKVYADKSVDISAEKNRKTGKLSFDVRSPSAGTANITILNKSDNFYLHNQSAKKKLTLNSRELLPKQSTELPLGKSRVVIGDIESGVINPAQFKLNQVKMEKSYLVLSPNSELYKLIEASELDTTLSMDNEGSAPCWVMINRKIAIGVKADNKLYIPKDKSHEIIAWLTYDDGYFITPNMNNRNGYVTINQQLTYGKVPIQQGCELKINGIAISITS